MKKSRYTESQIIGVLKEVDAGMKVEEVCRQHGISSATYYNWKSKYGGMEASDVKRLKELEEENELLREVLEESGMAPVEPGKGELFGFEATEGTFQFSVQNAEGKNTR